MAARKNTPGCATCCGGCTGQICVTVRGCNNSFLPGATVTISLGGTTIGTGTTDASGKFCVAITSAATYTIVVSKTRFNSSTTTYAATCSMSANTPSVALTPATGFICVPCCVDPLSTATKTLTTTWGVISLPYLGLVTGGINGLAANTPVWGGCNTISVNAYSADPFGAACNIARPVVATTLPVAWFFFCGSDTLATGGWHLIQWSYQCSGTTWGEPAVGTTPFPCSPPSPTNPGTASLQNIESLSTGSPVCLPLSVNFTLGPGTILFDGTATVTD